MDDAHKHCRLCGELRPFSEFHKNPAKPDGLDGRCRACKKEQYLLRRDVTLARAREEYGRNKVAIAEQNSTLERHIKRLVNCSNRKKTELSFEYVLDIYNKQGGLCALTGKTMTHLAGSGKVDTNISIDRIDNSVWYKEGNVQLVCYRANIIRNELSKKGLIHWCEAILENHNG